MPDSIKVFASATVANLACGFDVVGVALNSPGDVIEIKKRENPGIHIVSIEGDGGVLPKESTKNTAAVALAKLLDLTGYKCGFEISIRKQMPIGSGLGSSAASSAAATFGANYLLGLPLSEKELVLCASEGERVACGSAHFDNVAPALLGGVVLVHSTEPFEYSRINPPIPLWFSVVYPHFSLRTSDARRILNASVPLGTVVKQTRNLAGLILGLSSGDELLLGRSLKDEIIEPQRASLIPHFYKVKHAALESGALGCSISGGGPSIFALSRNQEEANRVGEVMQAQFSAGNIESSLFVSSINSKGARILE